MAYQIRCAIAIVSLGLLVSVPFFQQPTPTDRFKLWMTITTTGIRGQKMVVVKQHDQRIREVIVTTLREIGEGSSYQHRAVRPVEVDVTDSEKRGSRMSFTQRKMKLEFQSKREIPGGPDGRHHSSKSNGI